METTTEESMLVVDSLVPPYSLGKLIDWKQESHSIGSLVAYAPYSLGKLIDWKLSILGFKTSDGLFFLPTR